MLAIYSIRRTIKFSMSAIIHSLIDQGLDGVVIDVECHLSNNLPNIVIVGVADKAVDEARERLRGAFTASSLDLPRKRITLNLAPADIPKDGSSFDLAMATAILHATRQVLDTRSLRECLIFGELGLDGSIRPIRGLIGKLLAAKKFGYESFVIPEANRSQAELIPDIRLMPVSSLPELTRLLSVEPIFTPTGKRVPPVKAPTESSTDFCDVIGQAAAKRALEIAAAGQHNVLLSGAPGTGKSMLAKALPTILPELTQDEMLDITHIHSLSNHHYDKIVQTRPFRSPHHSASNVAIIGGGTKPRPGEISLAHHGILFLDELPEFARSTIETLRQPLEDKVISIARAKDSLEFPADFILIGTKNPCPCGFYGTGKPCTCTPQQVVLYEKKLSGPILDRIDLYVDVDSVEHTTLLNLETKEENSAAISERVSAARQKQYSRQKNQGKLNGSLTTRAVKQVADLTDEAKQLLDMAGAQLGLSARAYMRAVKVARTIADLDDSKNVTEKHIAEALQYRPKPASI